jgi:hypothetical protein
MAAAKEEGRLNVRLPDLPSVNFDNLLERLDGTLSGIFSRTFALADLLDFLLSQVESYLRATLAEESANNSR